MFQLKYSISFNYSFRYKYHDVCSFGTNIMEEHLFFNTCRGADLNFSILLRYTTVLFRLFQPIAVCTTSFNIFQ